MTLRDDLARVVRDFMQPEGFEIAESDYILVDRILASGLIRRIRAEAWDEGALWAAVECDVIPNETVQWLEPEDNPYREGQA